MPQAREKISKVISRIVELQPTFSETIELLRKRIANEESRSSGATYKHLGTYWRLVAYCDGLVKIRIMIERNFAVIESLGLLAMTRYLVELSIWIRLLAENEQYGLLYYRMLIKESQSYWERLVNQLQREVVLLNGFESKERGRLQQYLSKDLAPEADIGTDHLLQAILDEIDQESAKLFSVYSDDGKRNGYGFQAHLVKTKALPYAQAALEEAKVTMQEFDSSSAGAIRAIRPSGPWKWDDMARRAGMADEYEFIYSYASRMLHANPFNLTTDQKSLEDTEVYIFLRYCLVKMTEALLSVRNQLHASTMH